MFECDSIGGDRNVYTERDRRVGDGAVVGRENAPRRSDDAFRFEVGFQPEQKIDYSGSILIFLPKLTRNCRLDC